MNLQLLQVLLQGVSSFAIAGGLIFAALQMFYNRKAQHVANFAKLVEMQMQLRKMRVDDPSLASIYKHDIEGLNNDRDIREYFMNLMQLSVFEIVWFSHQHGQLPDDYYQSWVDRMKVIEEEDSFRKMINTKSMKILHNDFQRFVTELTREAGRAKAAGRS